MSKRTEYCVCVSMSICMHVVSCYFILCTYIYFFKIEKETWTYGHKINISKSARKKILGKKRLKTLIQ